MKKGSFKSGPG